MYLIHSGSSTCHRLHVSRGKEGSTGTRGRLKKKGYLETNAFTVQSPPTMARAPHKYITLPQLLGLRLRRILYPISTAVFNNEPRSVHFFRHEGIAVFNNEPRSVPFCRHQALRLLTRRKILTELKYSNTPYKSPMHYYFPYTIRVHHPRISKRSNKPPIYVNDDTSSYVRKAFQIQPSSKATGNTFIRHHHHVYHHHLHHRTAVKKFTNHRP